MSRANNTNRKITNRRKAAKLKNTNRYATEIKQIKGTNFQRKE